MTEQQELTLRNLGSSLICTMAASMYGVGASNRAAATTASVLFQRFFCFQSFARHDCWLLATACFLIATKIEEMHRRVPLVLEVAWAAAHMGRAMPFSQTDSEFAQLRDRVLDAERIVQGTLQFDESAEHPYVLVTGQIKKWRDAGVLGTKSEKLQAELQSFDRAACSLAFQW